MKFENYVFNKSSFLSVEKDLSLIIDKILENQRLKKLLYYTTDDALLKPNLTEQQSIGLLRKNIKLIPKLYIDSEVLNYIVISCDNFSTNKTNPEFRNNKIYFTIICHYNQWEMQDLQLRPYRIAAELDQMLDGTSLSGIGKLEFSNAIEAVLNDEFAGIMLTYDAIHGEEDRTHPYNNYNKQAYYGDV